MIRPSTEYVIEYAGREWRLRIERMTATEATQAAAAWGELFKAGSQAAQLDFANTLLFGEGRDMLVEAVLPDQQPYVRGQHREDGLAGRDWWQFFVPFVMQMEIVSTLLRAGVGKFNDLGKGSLLGPVAQPGQ